MAFEVKGLGKAYGGVWVLRGVDLAVDNGEIHALCGANGAGKSTLIKCVGGAVTPDEGEIVLGGKMHSSLTPKASREAGVSIIYQDFSLAPSLTVTENIFLGQELRRGVFVRRREQRAEARRLLERLGANVDCDQLLENLPGADLQIVEIAKAMRTEPHLLILDEPTSSLSEVEARALAEYLRVLKEHALPILYVTHRLGEVFEIADRVTVLRDGRVVLSASVKDVTREELVHAIVGAAEAVRERRDDLAVTTAPLLEAHGVVAVGIGPIDLTLQKGEVLGVFGLLGSGRTELLETLFGAREMSRGRLLLDGRPVRFRHPSEAIAAGIALVPSERLRKSVFLPLTSGENILMPRFRRLAAAGIRRQLQERRVFSRLAHELNLNPPRANLEARLFSGGNQQKLSLGRWLGADQMLRVLLLDEPTQGVDVGARADLYRTLQESVVESDRAVIVTSSEPEELMLLAHRVIVLSRGRIVGELAAAAMSERVLLELAHHGE